MIMSGVVAVIDIEDTTCFSIICDDLEIDDYRLKEIFHFNRRYLLIIYKMA